MRFVSIRELRHQSRELWKQVASGAEVILTSQGKPIALLTSVTGDTLEAALKAVRLAKAEQSLDRMWSATESTGRDKTPMAEIDAAVAWARRQRHARRTAE